MLPLDGPQVADLSAQAPFNFTQPATNAGEQYRLTYLEDTLVYNPGSSVATLVATSPQSAQATNLTQISGINIQRAPTFFLSASNVSHIFTGGATFQYLTMQTQTFAQNKLHIRRVVVSVDSNTVTGIVRFLLIHLTNALASGGTNLTLVPADPGQAATPVLNAATFQSAPTVQAGTDGTGPQIAFNLGVIAGTTSDTGLVPLVLYDYQGALTSFEERRPITIGNSLNNDGWALAVTCAAATTLTLTFWVELTAQPSPIGSWTNY